MHFAQPSLNKSTVNKGSYLIELLHTSSEIRSGIGQLCEGETLRAKLLGRLTMTEPPGMSVAATRPRMASVVSV